MSTESHPEPIVTAKTGISAIWLVPIVALIFGAWLVVKAVGDRGVFITIEFDNATGIVAGKTEIRYKGLTVGVVRDIETSSDLQSVIVEAEVISDAKDTLTDETLFWYVTADVSLSGVKGLDTLLSGSYINVRPDIDASGKSQRHFVGLKEEPEVDESAPGLHIVLTSDTLGSIVKDSPVTFKQIMVGHVASYRYDDQRNEVDINLYIKPEFAHLVKQHSRFWNASGLTVSGSLTTGLHVDTDSLASILSGGIAFDTPDIEGDSVASKNGDRYKLHQHFQDAEMGYAINLKLDWNSELDAGAAIVYQGITLGRLESFTNINPLTREITALAKVNPRIAPYLNSSTQFYLMAPELDLGGVTNLHNIITGAQIGMRPSLDGDVTDTFRVYSQKPAYHYSEPGLHLILTTNDVNSLKVGTHIFYKQQVVGNIQAIENTGPSAFEVHIHIQPQYQSYVSKDSRFWNASGVRIAGNIQQLDIQSQSMQAILAGGIAFDKGVAESAGKSTAATQEQANNGDTFVLYEHIDMAKQRVAIELAMATAKDVRKGTRIMYRGEQIGAVHSIRYIDDSARLAVGILPEFRWLLKEDTQFWLVKSKLTLSGLTDTEALFGGNYFNVDLGSTDKNSTLKNSAERRQFVALDKAPAKHTSAEGLQLTVVSETGSEVSPGSPISYRGIVVGQVDNIELAQDGENVAINITIDEQYRHLVHDYTRFYHAGGFTITGNLTDFVVKTESAETVLTGGLSFFNPDGVINPQPTQEAAQYRLFNDLRHAQNAGVAIRIAFNQVAGLKPNLAIKYQGQDIGVVERIVFDSDHHGATAIAYLNHSGRKFAVSGTKFWFAEPEVGLVGSKNVEAFITGGFIDTLPANLAIAGNGIATAQTEFTAEDYAPAVTQLPYGLNLQLTAKRLGSVRVGNPVLYRQVKVGEVIGADLAPTADQVHIFINIEQRFAKLVSPASQFWNTSGFSMDAGLFSGVSVDAESIETILAGGIAFATPDDQAGLSPVAQGHSFTLKQNPAAQWQEWSPKIQLNR
ncbi:PqiB family protein [Thalassotalea euphylliae]|nr:MlaD family protein [Thalassotalea euphylliae]